jgi:uncharacterized membrane protein YGL010W
MGVATCLVVLTRRLLVRVLTWILGFIAHGLFSWMKETARTQQRAA